MFQIVEKEKAGLVPAYVPELALAGCLDRKSVGFLACRNASTKPHLHQRSNIERGVFVHLKFKNWDKYNKRQKDIRKPFWFAMSNEIFLDPLFAELSDQERLAFLYLLCEASRQNKYGECEISPRLFCQITGYKTSVLESTFDKLLKSGAAAGSRQDGGKMAAETRPLQDKTVQDITRQDSKTSEGVKAPTRSLGSEIWEAYREAYKKRYQVEPVRNATTNAQCSSLAKRLGRAAIDIVQFYLTHNDGFYLKNQHPIGLCLHQAESLHTQWQRGVAVTSTQVRDFEKSQSTHNALEGALEILKRRNEA